MQWITHRRKLNGLLRINQGSEHRRLAKSVARNLGLVKNNRISLSSQFGIRAGDSLKNLENIVTSLATLEKLDHQFSRHKVVESCEQLYYTGSELRVKVADRRTG